MPQAPHAPISREGEFLKSREIPSIYFFNWCVDGNLFEDVEFYCLLVFLLNELGMTLKIDIDDEWYFVNLLQIGFF